MIAKRYQKYIDPQLLRPKYSLRVACQYFDRHGHRLSLAQDHQYQLAELGDFPHATIPIGFAVSTVRPQGLALVALLVLAPHL